MNFLMRFLQKRDDAYRDLRAIAEDEQNRARRNAGRGYMFALEIPFSVIVGAVLGKFLDDTFNTAPYGFAVFLCAGVAASVRAIMRVIAWQKSLDAPASSSSSSGQEPADDDQR